jgi:lipoprotein-releasing system permease protein
MDFTSGLQSLLNEYEPVEAYAGVVQEKVLLRYDNKQEIVLVRGVDTAYSRIVSPGEVMIFGDWPRGDNPLMAMGQSLASKLSVSLNDYENPVYLILPGKLSAFQGASLISRPFLVSGIYRMTPEIEKKYVFIPLSEALRLLKLPPGKISFVDVRLRNEEELSRTKEYLKQKLPAGLRIKDKYELNKSVFKMLNMENLITYTVGVLFLVISIFNIVGSIIILVLNKKRDRFVLKALGLPLDKVRAVFFRYGVMLIIISGIIGMVLGLILVTVQLYTGWIKIPGTNLVYPVRLEWKNFVAVLLTLVLIAVVSSRLAVFSVREIKEKM